MSDPVAPNAADTGKIDAPPSPKIVNGTLLIAAFGFCAMMMITVMFLSYGESSTVKLQFFSSAAFPCGLVVFGALAAMGFNVGKIFEGTVAKGFISAAAAQSPAIKAIEAIGEPLKMATLQSNPQPQVLINSTNTTVNHDPNSSGSLPIVVPRPVEPQASIKDVFGKAVLLLILPSMLFAGGCVSTSAIFQRSVKAGIDNVVTDMNGYTKIADYDSNHNGQLDPSEISQQSAEKSLTERLAQTVNDPATIDLETVASPWAEMEPVWRSHVIADPTLTDEDRTDRLPTADRINDLIKNERERQAALWRSLGLSEK